MSCYHPITAVYNPKLAEIEGKKTLHFNWPDFYEYRNGHFVLREGMEEIEVPCGQCIGCRLQYSRQWALRIQKEASTWEHNYFLTLTYDDMHIPNQDVINEATGEIILGHPLNPNDITKFMKRLRITWQRKFGSKNIRFYLCGEYGKQTERPHYHICLMNFPIPEEELEFYKHNELGDNLYKCDLIEKIWGKGIIVVGSLTWQSAAYVARYMLKKQKGNPEQVKTYYKSQGKIPEFTRCSRKPGIAREWYELHKDEIYKNDEIFVPKRGGGTLKLKPAGYFDRLYDLEHPKEMLRIKEARKAYALRAKKLKLTKCNLHWEEILEIAEENHKERASKLVRKEI